jgi:NAD(P)-dependent dehydrogenase (short-subunit alcohol dehydrogenase family)
MITSVAGTLGGTGEYTWYGAAKGAVNTLVAGVGREVARKAFALMGWRPA